MTNKNKKTTKASAKYQQDLSESRYFMRLLILVILGSFWLRFTDLQTWVIPLPIGLFLGLIMVSHQRFKIDRKIGYAVLLIAMFVGFWTPLGLNISL